VVPELPLQSAVATPGLFEFQQAYTSHQIKQPLGFRSESTKLDSNLFRKANNTASNTSALNRASGEACPALIVIFSVILANSRRFHARVSEFEKERYIGQASVLPKNFSHYEQT
jgi:hypothetical protein